MSVRYIVWIALTVTATVHRGVGQTPIGIGPGFVDTVGGVYGEVHASTHFTVSSGVNGARVKFKIDRVEPARRDLPNFLIVSPSSGTTPATIFVGPNPNVTRTMLPGTYSAGVFVTTVDQSPPVTAGAIARLTLRAPPPPAVTRVTSSASFEPVVSPGALVSIFGDNLGPPVLSSEYDSTGLYPTRFGNTTVTFNSTPAPLLYVSPGQINAVVPYAVSAQRTAQVVVSRYGESSPAFAVPVAETSPAIFTATQSGSGQGAILNYDSGNYTPNSPDNPAPPGSVITLFATGVGRWEEEVEDASISVVARPFVASPVSLTIAGEPATILYAGAAPYRSIGTLQVNAIVPPGAPSGEQPVVLTVGGTDNAQQKATIAIR